MGLSVAPGVFQNYMYKHSRCFKARCDVRQLLQQGSVFEVLVDDFLVGTPTWEDHRQLLRYWFEYAESNKLRFKATKCEFFQNTLVVFGRQVGCGHWGPLADRLTTTGLKTPQNVAKLHSALGEANWIRDIFETSVRRLCWLSC